MMAPAPTILVEGLEKSYGDVVALRGLDLVAHEGSVLAVLGPNGAGKTTVVRILTTLLRPDAGRAEVVGLDVVRQGHQLRSRIGLAGQNAAVDERLTGFENLVMFGQLYHLSKARARRRADELLERLDLEDAASRLVKTYSGGMRRRLDLAACLVMEPSVLFLDEPTAGLDPRSRLAMWETVEEMVGGGTTVLLTTQYLEEADRLATRIAVIDGGRVIASGSSDELKMRVGGERIEVSVVHGYDFNRAVAVLAPYADGELRLDEGRQRIVMPASGTTLLATIVLDLHAAGIEVGELALRRPTLDDVFLAVTGHVTQEDGIKNPSPMA